MLLCYIIHSFAKIYPFSYKKSISKIVTAVHGSPILPDWRAEIVIRRFTFYRKLQAHWIKSCLLHYVEALYDFVYSTLVRNGNAGFDYYNSLPIIHTVCILSSVVT